MSEIGDGWAAYKEASREKKEQDPFTHATKLLDLYNVPYKSLNNGVQLLVTGQVHMFDFWPKTGRFLDRNTRTSSTGIFKLLKLCGV